MTIASAVAEIRNRRQVVVLSREPWSWRVLSTAGGYHHVLRWDAEFEQIVCDTCRLRHGRSNCWARQRCLEHLQQAAKDLTGGTKVAANAAPLRTTRPQPTAATITQEVTP